MPFDMNFPNPSSSRSSSSISTPNTPELICMSSRREFLATSTAAGLTAALSTSLARAATQRRSVKVRSPLQGIVRREETTRRYGGNGDNWHMSWAADDRQFVGLCDGFGWENL